MTAWVWLLGLTLAAQVPPPRAAELESESLRAEGRAIRKHETDELLALAARLGVAGRQSEAEAVLRAVEPPPSVRGPYRFLPLPEVVPARPKSPSQGLANVPPAGAVDETAAIRARAARDLAALAMKALGGPVKHYSVADASLRAVLVRDPDHADARRLLGYVPHDGGWATPFAVDQFKKGKVLHATYGWVDAAWVPHLERRQLPARGMTNPRDARWLPAADADAQRDSIERGWTITTEHFEILSDVPLSEVIAFGRKVELFHDLLFSLLADVIADDLPLARRFRDKGKTQPRPPVHTILYFATRDEYLEALRTRGESNLEDTLGIYIAPRKPNVRRAPAYFFRDAGGALDATATLFHEVSHQLLLELSSSTPNAYRKNVGNFWVFEGLGTYFETVDVQPDNSLLVGGYVGPRIQNARRGMLENDPPVSIAQLVRQNQAGLLGPDKETARMNYAKAMALTVYILEGRDGKYREGYFDYLRDALRGRLRADGNHQLDDRLGVSYAELDAELLADLKAN